MEILTEEYYKMHVDSANSIVKDCIERQVIDYEIPLPEIDIDNIFKYDYEKYKESRGVKIKKLVKIDTEKIKKITKES